jgi:ATP-dependent helicase/nuclease subunit B
MSLRIIYGKAGSGKSSFVFNEIKDEKNFGKIFVITPEQFSYISEKKLLETLDEKASINSEILSFNRIAHRIELEVGGVSKVDLSESGKAMLVYSILSENKKDLKFLGNSEENIDLVLRTITELKKHSISTDTLEQSRETLENEYLKMKLDDICGIYSKYQNSIINKFIDEDDKLTLLAKRISSSHMFDDAEVYIDEFAGFTAIEYEIIKEILKKAKRVSITICADNLETGTDIETDIFYYNKQVAHKLIRI